MPPLAPEEASDTEIAAERLRVAKAYLDCKTTIVNWEDGIVTPPHIVIERRTAGEWP